MLLMQSPENLKADKPKQPHDVVSDTTDKFPGKLLRLRKNRSEARVKEFESEPHQDAVLDAVD
jgi:hypothetical protein